MTQSLFVEGSPTENVTSIILFHISQYTLLSLHFTNISLHSSGLCAECSRPPCRVMFLLIFTFCTHVTWCEKHSHTQTFMNIISMIRLSATNVLRVSHVCVLTIRCVHPAIQLFHAHIVRVIICVFAYQRRQQQQRQWFDFDVYLLAQFLNTFFFFLLSTRTHKWTNTIFQFHSHIVKVPFRHYEQILRSCDFNPTVLISCR